MYNIP